LSRQQLLGEPRVYATATATSRSQTTQTGTNCTVSSKSSSDLRSCVRAAVVRCDDFDIFNGAAPITVLVLEPCVGQLNVPLVVGQLVLASPLTDSI
jgi:hypothetical protein